VGEPHILSAAAALPENYVDQETLLAAFRAHWGRKHFNLDRLEQLHRSVRVGGRHLALPLDRYAELESFAQRNDAWIAAAVELGEKALEQALLRADLRPRDVDHLYFVTVTGLSTPSIDARLMNRMGLRDDVKRVPLFGLGCVAGAAGLARASDAVRAFPGQVAGLVAVELCSLTLQREDLSVANIIASGLFGDGAAAVLIGGGDRPARGPRVLATRSVFYPGTERVMGWDVVDSGFKVVLSPQVLELPREALRRTWDSLQEVGNLSSASVLFVLRDLLDSGEARPGDLGLLIAMGPGFCSELVLLRW